MLKIKKFIFSNKNMVGLSLASLAIMFALIGVLKQFWIVVMILSYIFGYLVTPKDKELKFYHIKGENIDDYMGFMTKLTSRVQESNKIPEEAKEIMKKLQTTTDDLFSFIKQNNDMNELGQDMYNFKNIFDTYLPKIINQYEKLPTSYAKTVKSSNGKTADQMLIEQLNIINQKVTEIAYAMYENDLTMLKVNGKFLQQKFQENNSFEIEKMLK